MWEAVTTWMAGANAGLAVYCAMGGDRTRAALSTAVAVLLVLIVLRGPH